MESRADPLVLIVEPNTDLRLLVRTILETDLHVRIATAEDGDQGLEMAARLQPDLVLLAVRLPKLSGLDVAKRLKAEPLTRSIPLVAMTTESRATTLAAGCDDHLDKPFDLRTLVGTTQRYLCPS